MKLIEFTIPKAENPMYVIPYNVLCLDVQEDEEVTQVTYFKPDDDDYNFQVGHA